MKVKIYLLIILLKNQIKTPKTRIKIEGETEEEAKEWERMEREQNKSL